VLGLVGMSTSSIFKNNKFNSQGINSWVWYCHVSVLAVSGAVCNVSAMV
jgi:hypothetical protein